MEPRTWPTLSGALPRWAFLFVGLSSGCASLGYRNCDEPPTYISSALPARLSSTGLFANIADDSLGEGVVAYSPQFELWSDGATKRRWLYLPHGSLIDTADMDAWRFPVGTKLWKEFSRDGVRVETRLLQRVGEAQNEWAAAAYIWAGNGDAYLSPKGSADARGTRHVVPAANQCMGCHGGSASRVLGFSAIQLGDDRVAGYSVSRLVAEHKLTRPPSRSLRLPGDESVRATLGYFHANCGHCHNAHRPHSEGARCFDPRKDFDLSSRSDQLESVWATPAYLTTIGRIVQPGSAANSKLFQRLQSETFFRSRMPPLGTHDVDPYGVRLIEAWIGALPRPEPNPYE
jgi:hypothetical protein